MHHISKLFLKYRTKYYPKQKILTKSNKKITFNEQNLKKRFMKIGSSINPNYKN